MHILERELESLIVSTCMPMHSLNNYFETRMLCQTQKHLAKTTEYIHACGTSSSISLLHFMSEVEPGGRTTCPLLPIGIRTRGCTPKILSFIFKSLACQKSPEAAQ